MAPGAAGCGVALLLSALGSLTATGPALDARVLGAGTLLVLVGSVVLLPWLVDAVVRRLDGGPVPWQLAVRRLQLTGATSARVVGGVAVAAAGTIALQMLFSGLALNYQTSTAEDPSRADVVSTSFGRSGDQLTAIPGTLEGVAGVRSVLSTAEIAVGTAGDAAGTDGVLIVGDCAALAEVAVLGACADGDVFLSTTEGPVPALAGGAVVLEGGAELTLPVSAPIVDARPDPAGQVRNGILATPGAVDVSQVDGVRVDSYLLADVATPGVVDGVVTALVSLDPLAVVRQPQVTDEANRFTAVRTGLSIGALLSLLTIGASLLVSGLEQMAQRRRVLAALAAVGTPRATLGWSLLLQTAIPVLLGMALAAVMGTGLGAVLLAVAGTPLRFDPGATATITGLAALVVLGVTAGLLPGLRRSMRPDGLWSE